MIVEEEDYLAHYGILRRSGRYPWGSGGDDNSFDRDFLGYVAGLKKQGLTDKEVADGVGMTIAELRASKSIAKNREKQAKIGMAQRLKDKGYSNVAIGERMGLRESSVRALLAPGEADKVDVLHATANMLREQVAAKTYVDIGVGAELHTNLGISGTKLSTAVAMLREEGYEVRNVKIEQLGTGKQTELKVLCPPGTTQKQLWQNRYQVRTLGTFSEDGGRSYTKVQTPISIDSRRISVRYSDQGGAAADGVIYVRPGVSDLSLGGSRYSQVRIAVDGTHYLKGMAIYKDDLPPGVDLQFNTNKNNTGNKLDAMKLMKDDPDLPFGSVVRQLTSPDGKVSSAMNIVNDEADWEKWSRNLSSQMLSKQSPALAKAQLAMTYERRKNEFNEIVALTNPAVKKKLLQSYADSVDSAAIHLKAAALPRQKTHVILPLTTIKETEIYAPNFNNGERVVLIRFPHGGTFEIPELTVNNKNPEGRKTIGTGLPSVAIGIHHKVAQHLSGADFDGDTVLVIPNNNRQIKTSRPLKGLEKFDPVHAYPAYEGMPPMNTRTKGMQMGLVSNLITDMTIKGANNDELARAVRHSMVVIDAEKHNLNYKQSAIDNGIPQLMEKYQNKKTGGASTLISNSGSKATIRVPERILRPASKGGPIDPVTGKLIFVETGASYQKAIVNKKTGQVINKTVVKTTELPKLSTVEDVHAFSSGTVIEKIYADHSNSLRDLANQARKAMVSAKAIPYSPSAKTAYAKEVATLNSKLTVALKNAPLERQAQILANAEVALKRHAYPDMESSDVKKIKAQALNTARARTQARKQRIEITDSEWDAIQAGAISTNKLNNILDNADLNTLKELATPKSKLLMTSVKKSRARQMLLDGYTQSEVAQHLGVSLTTLKNSLGG